MCSDLRTVVGMSGGDFRCREATSGRAGCLSSIIGDVSPRLDSVGFGRIGTDRKSGIDLRSVGKRCRVLMSGVDVGQRYRASDLVSDKMLMSGSPAEVGSW